MAQSASVENIRHQLAYWNAELALAISLHQLGRVGDDYLSLRVRAVSNIQHKKDPLFHCFSVKKTYSYQ